MSKGLGITALVLAIVGFFVPAITVYWVWLTMLVIAASLFTGSEGRTLAVAAWCVSLVNLLILSPLFWVLVSEESFFAIGTVVFAVLPIVAYMLKKGKTEPTTDS